MDNFSALYHCKNTSGKPYPYFLFLWVLIPCFFGCQPKVDELREGMWRGTLKTDSKVEIPFNFSVSDSAGNKVIYILNGAERLKVDEITRSEDSVLIRMPFFDSEIKARLTRKGLKGSWVRHIADKDVEMPFNADYNVDWRFFKIKEESEYKVSGRWSVLFVSTDGKDTTVAVGEFKQNKAKVTGTFLTTTGDYRFLEGNLSNNVLSLSTFDGANALLFTGKLTSDTTIVEGMFYSGKSSVRNWTATKDDKAMLPDPYTVTTLKNGTSQLNFKFPDLNGHTVSLQDERFKNKVVVVQFLGTWCPNCMDETTYLAPFYTKYKGKGVEVVGLAYERTTDFEKSRQNLERLKERLNIGYPLLITGYTNKEVLKSIPAFNEFKAFPTTLLIDKQGRVRKIHTGFSGPGTGSHYTDFITEFEEQVNKLLEE